jgi:hypothetical protein
VSAGWVAVVIPALITAVAVAAFTISDRRARRRETAAKPDGLGKLIAGCKATGQQNLAWPPQPPLIEKLPPRIGRDDCGCLWFEEGLWSPCGIHDTGVLRAHINQHADQWAANLWESQ